ncbi:MAG TPA: bi-domain-containing oxidoreductase [Bryobacteraceae bacterium]|nr:bi-domain-containing oxidoreductase [Bryobacteraceae bacterium]
MKQVLIKSGSATVSEVPAPHVGRKNILVQVSHSCVSVGTEMAGVRMSGLPLYRRALKQPENVKLVMEMVRDQGLKRTMDRVSGKLAAGAPTGYSAAGVIIAVGEEVEGFAIGERVACAGAGIANHAEVIDVPVNLAVKLPENVRTDVGSTVTLGSIALQGVRRANPTLGETFVIVGLGILGQMTVQMLTANGCRVIGVDLDPKRIATALANGMYVGIDPSLEDYVGRVAMYTDGMGADGVIITAAASSDKIVSEAMQACRKKGRVVLVGDVGLNLKRADFYKKEIDFLISCSYGPGRYDPVYEEGGQDYPLPYVRWTENRNMQAYIDLISAGKMKLEDFFGEPYPIERASDAYEALKQDGDKPLMVLLSYPQTGSVVEKRRVDIGPRTAKSNKIRVGLAGASSFAQGVHLPNMTILRKDFELRAVMSRTGANARAVATQNQAAYCTTDFDEILRDDEIDLVIIATRHDLHGEMALRSLRAGKHTFVEKPLALTLQELDALAQFYAENPDGPVLMVGFNRRFAPAIAHVRGILKNRTTPIIANYRMNAGYIPLDHWVHGPEGGGRNIGEACHIYDLFGSLCGSAAASISATAIDPSSKQWARNDNFVATISYADGSVCTLTYTALGDKSFPKERMDVFADGKVIVMDDFKSVEVHGGRHKSWSAATIQKGQLQELEALADTLLRGKPWPISLAEQLDASRVAIEVERLVQARN